MSRPADDRGKLMHGFLDGAQGPPLVQGSDPEVLARLQRLLASRIEGLCFSAYLEGQSPERRSRLSEDQVRARLELVAPHTRWIRTFSCTDGNEHAPRLAHELGLKTLVGAWISGDSAQDALEIEALVEVARAGHADRVAVGNEVLLRGELEEPALLERIRQVKAALPDVPVGYVDAYYEFVQRPALVEACDFLPVNCYPFWEACPLDLSLAHVAEMVRRVRANARGKPVWIAETGWPSSGAPVGPAVPSPAHLARYAVSVLEWAESAGVPLFWFAAFDEAWKVGAEGDRGASWGFWTADGRSKLGGEAP
jgi:exo-beta-1,3-glucanase (GH17 family)